MVCRSRLHIARPQSLTNVRKSTQLPTFVSYWRLVTGWLTANRQISTWKISILHGAIFYFPRGRESFPPKFHLIPPKFYFFSTWRFFVLHVEIFCSPRGDFRFSTWRVSRKVQGRPEVIVNISFFVSSPAVGMRAYLDALRYSPH